MIKELLFGKCNVQKTKINLLELSQKVLESKEKNGLKMVKNILGKWLKFIFLRWIMKVVLRELKLEK